MNAINDFGKILLLVQVRELEDKALRNNEITIMEDINNEEGRCLPLEDQLVEQRQRKH